MLNTVKHLTCFGCSFNDLSEMLHCVQHDVLFYLRVLKNYAA
jgi:hypothetical protein